MNAQEFSHGGKEDEAGEGEQAGRGAQADQTVYTVLGSAPGATVELF